MKFSPLLLGIAAIAGLAASAGAAALPAGANISWITYEAEHCQTNAKVLGPDYSGHTPAREASGRQCLKLVRTGDYLEFSAKADAQGVVIRYCIPDAPAGGGTDATLGLLINGEARGDLRLTSRYAYLYGEYPFSNDPAAGVPRHFWDEVRLMPGAIHRGDVIRLEKRAEDKAPWYLIDFVDLETVPGALQQPAGAISVTDFGAKGDGQSDCRSTFLAAIAKAQTSHRTLWIPPGKFKITGMIPLDHVALRGAGMWYSTLVGSADYSPSNRICIEGHGSHIALSDFAIVGNLDYRNDSEANDGLGGSFGTDSVIRSIWVEHTKTGAWLTNSDGLIVEGCRFRDTIADGINLCVGMRNTIVRNCTVRNSGDDCFAIWPAAYAKAEYEAGGNQIIHCTAELPFLAQAFSIYGGDSNSVQDCSAMDIPYGAGILASTMFPTESGFGGITHFENIDMVRAGDRDGAIAVMTNLRDLKGLRFDHIQCVDSPTDGIKFTSVAERAISDVAFDHIRIVHPGISGTGSGVAEAADATGSATFSNIIIDHPKTRAWENKATAFRLIRKSGNITINSRLSETARFAAARAVAP